MDPAFACGPGHCDRPRLGYRPAGNAVSPAVSVITPFYNDGPVFHETRRCVLEQTLQAFEWIIVNDGSTRPEALQILDGLRQCGDPRVRVVDHPVNRGLSAARNTGYRNARAPYVFQLDADDLIEPTTLEKLAWLLESRPWVSFAKGLTVGFGAKRYLWKHGFHDGIQFLSRNMCTATAMVRRSVHEGVGGYDEGIRGGFEDWDFWLRCADQGHWGQTLHEHLDWYRRREDHESKWENWSDEQRVERFREEVLAVRYPRLFHGEFPAIERHWATSFDAMSPDPPFANPLERTQRRVLMIVPWMMMGGADKYNVRVAEQLRSRGWGVTVVTTKDCDHGWMPQFARVTPDVFALDRFLEKREYPRFLRYLIESRRYDVVLMTNSELGYWLLPFLRRFCPGPAYVDYCHMEEEYWKNGGYPRYAAWSQDLLEMNIVSSEHLKRWMVDRGADPDRIEVCTTNEDTSQWRPRPRVRRRLRERMDIPQDRIVLLYAGRMVPQKKPDVFVEVVRRLRDEGLDFTALVAGDGPWMGHIVGLANQHGLWSHLKILGERPIAEMPRLMAASDIFFLPSKWEGISLALYEAMAVGLVCVGAVVGGQRELVTHDCGVLILDADDAVQVELYTSELASLIRDPDRIRRMGRLARRRIKQNYRLCDMGQRMIELFDRAIQRRDELPPDQIPERFAIECAARGVEYLRAFSLCEQLWHERDEFKHRLEAGHPPPPPAPDLQIEVKRMVQENIRYRLADRVNNALKVVGIHRPIKALVRRAISPARNNGQGSG